MSKAIQRFSLDVTHPDVQASVRIMQGDDNRQWRFTFTEAGRPFDLPARCTAMLVGTKPDDTVLENGLVVQGNEVIYDFGAADPENGIEQISTVPGSFEVQILLFDEYGAVLHAPRLWVTVFSSSYTERMANVSMDQFGGIKELIARLVGMEGNVETLLTRLTSQGTVTIAPEQWTDAAPFRADVFMPDDVFGKGCVVMFAPEDDATKDAAGKAMLSMTIGGTVDQNKPSPDYVVIARAESGEAPTIPLNFRYIVLKTGTEDKALVAMIGVDAVGTGGASVGGNASVKSGYVSIPVSDWKDSSPTSATIHIDGFETGSVCLLTPADSATKTASEEARLGTIPSSGISNSVFIRAQAGKVPTTQLNFKYMILRSEDDTGAPLAAIIGIDAAGSAEAGGVDETAVKNIINSVVPEWARASTKPTYNKDDVGLGNVDNVKQYSNSNQPDYPVDSVNGKTGAVKLNADDVGADPSGTAATKVSEHDTYTGSHNDIRLLIKALQEQVNKFLDVDDTTRDELSEVLAMIDANSGTLESLTSSKVNVTDIVDNLTTNVKNKPLSAAQGVALKALIDALSTGKLDASALGPAITTALKQAKESGEFDCEDEVYVGDGDMPDGAVLQIVIEDDEETDDEETGGESSFVQSDWNQTDETAADFIKNKPFGESFREMVGETELTGLSDGGMFFAEREINGLTGGDELVVKFDGVEYTCTPLEGSGDGQYLYGNGELFGLPPTDYPFSLVTVPEVAMYALYWTEGEKHVISISGNMAVPIATKYIPNIPFEKVFNALRFYCKDNDEDVYVYKDSLCTTKLTVDDLPFGYPIFLQSMYGRNLQMQVLSLGSASHATSGAKGWALEVCLHGNTKYFYTAEYTPET